VPGWRTGRARACRNGGLARCSVSDALRCIIARRGFRRIAGAGADGGAFGAISALRLPADRDLPWCQRSAVEVPDGHRRMDQRGSCDRGRRPHPLQSRGIVDQGIATALIDPGKAWQNGATESFNGKFRDECLSLEWFRSRTEAKVLIEARRQHFNMVRPHSSRLSHAGGLRGQGREARRNGRPKRRVGSLRYMGRPRPAPSHNRPARGKPKQQSG
jgi:Integrase core domain